MRLRMRLSHPTGSAAADRFSRMSDVWAVLLPAVFGLLGTLSGGYLTYRGTGAAEARAARRDARASLVTLLDSVLQVDPDASHHRQAAREAVTLLITEGLPANTAIELLDAASHWARLLPQLQNLPWASMGLASTLPASEAAVKTGPDVRRDYGGGVERRRAARSGQVGQTIWMQTG
jgi:hypothetical protein